MADLAPIKTDWLPGVEKPTRAGVYERNLAPKGSDMETVAYSKWDGEKWLSYRSTPKEANAVTLVSDFQALRWRGVVPEFEGCVPVPAPDLRDVCLGCEFDSREQLGSCLESRALAACGDERIIWRPRSEVSNG